MLNGIDPIIIFNFKKIIPAATVTKAETPLTDDQPSILLPVIPMYLSERLTGVLINSESKSVIIQTDTETKSNGTKPENNQKGVENTVKIEMTASKDSIGVSLFGAMSDLIFEKVTSKEYSITYLHGAVTVFGGLLHGFSINQSDDSDLYKMTLELIKPAATATQATGITNVPKVTGAVPL